MSVSINVVRPVASRGGGSEIESIKAQISTIVNQLIKLSTKLKEIENSDLPPLIKSQQAKPVRAQIDLLSQQLARLMAELVKKMSEKRQDPTAETKQAPTVMVRGAPVSNADDGNERGVSTNDSGATIGTYVDVLA